MFRTIKMHVFCILALVLVQQIIASENETLETATSVAINYAAAANAYGLPGHYARHYTYFTQKPVQTVELLPYYFTGPNFPSYGRGYHGFFGRTYNYANFGYGGIFGGHGLPLYSELIGLGLYH